MHTGICNECRVPLLAKQLQLQRYARCLHFTAWAQGQHGLSYHVVVLLGLSALHGIAGRGRKGQHGVDIIASHSGGGMVEQVVGSMPGRQTW
tara:strand:+ start:261 stop:536 length:276 start_codon:yes stop_codon:yes gene_type:complete